MNPCQKELADEMYQNPKTFGTSRTPAQLDADLKIIDGKMNPAKLQAMMKHLLKRKTNQDTHVQVLIKQIFKYPVAQGHMFPELLGVAHAKSDTKLFTSLVTHIAQETSVQEAYRFLLGFSARHLSKDGILEGVNILMPIWEHGPQEPLEGLPQDIRVFTLLADHGALPKNENQLGPLIVVLFSKSLEIDFLPPSLEHYLQHMQQNPASYASILMQCAVSAKPHQDLSVFNHKLGLLLPKDDILLRACVEAAPDLAKEVCVERRLIAMETTTKPERSSAKKM